MLHPECASCLQGHAARMEAIANAAPTDIAERARRAVYALGPMIDLADLSDDEIQHATDIIAAEFKASE
jgi:hypothetical protein